MRRREAYGLASVLLMLAAGPAYSRAGEGDTDYPQSEDRETLVTWLGKRTNIAPATVVSVTPELVVAIVGKTQPATPGGPVRLTLREEVIAAAYVPTVGGRSSLMSMEIQCEERRVRMDERRLYSGPNLTGSAEITEPSSTWVRIPDASIMDEVARAACDTSYPWPLQVAEVKPQATTTAVLAPPAPVAPPVPEPLVIAQVEPEPAPPPPPAPEPVVVAEAPPPEEPAPIVAAEAPANPAPVIPAPEPPAPVLAEVEPEPPPPAAEEIQPLVVAAAPPVAESIPEPRPEPPPPSEPQVITLPAGGPVFAIQIGAYQTEERAQEAWEALSAERPVLVENLRFETRPVQVKGRTLLRGLVREFASPEAAAAFCTALAGTGYGCIARTLPN